jgi:hypothetical protein
MILIDEIINLIEEHIISIVGMMILIVRRINLLILLTNFSVIAIKTPMKSPIP